MLCVLCCIGFNYVLVVHLCQCLATSLEMATPERSVLLEHRVLVSTTEFKWADGMYVHSWCSFSSHNNGHWCQKYLYSKILIAVQFNPQTSLCNLSSRFPIKFWHVVQFLLQFSSPLSAVWSMDGPLLRSWPLFHDSTDTAVQTLSTQQSSSQKTHPQFSPVMVLGKALHLVDDKLLYNNLIHLTIYLSFPATSCVLCY